MSQKTFVVMGIVAAFCICVVCMCAGAGLLRSLESISFSSGGDGHCTSPPQSFQESDLVGTWLAGPGTGTDTLVLKADHTYQQIYDNQVTNEHYESPWQKWWVEKLESGTLYLHLDGKRLCHEDEDDCYQERNVGGDWPGYDPCEDRIVTMQGKVILVIRGIPKQFIQPPRGIELLQPMADADTAPTVYILQP